MAENRKKKTADLIIFIVISMIAAVLVAVLIYTAVCNSNNKIPFIFDNSFLQIKTKSMEPEIPEGGYIGVNRITPEEIKTNDIIVFNSRDPLIYGLLNTHRVIEILYNENGELSGFVTKGDNNLAVDEFITYPEDVCGIFTKNIGWLTDVEDFISQKLIVFLLLLIPSLSLAGIIVRLIAEKSDKRRSDKCEELFKTELEKLRKNGLPPEYYNKPDDINTRCNETNSVGEDENNNCL